MVENMAVLVACSTLVELVQGVGHKPVLLVMEQIWCSMPQGRSPYTRCYKPWDMLQVVLSPFGRSRVVREQHKMEGEEGKEQKCISGEGVVEVVEVVEEAEAEVEVVEGEGEGFE